MISKRELFDLKDTFGSLLLRGPDAASFLQAQLPLDVTGVTQGTARWTCWADAKGRVRALLHAGRLADDDWVLIAAQDHLAALRKIRMFVLRSRVEISEGPPLTGSLVFGDGASPVIEAPTVRLSAGRVIHLAAIPQEGCLSGAVWQAVGALAGEAQLSTEVCSKEIPQSLGLRAGAGFSLRKGCFPGQEIISRVHYRGRPPRYLHTSIAPSRPDDALFSADIPGSGLLISQSLRRTGDANSAA